MMHPWGAHIPITLRAYRRESCPYIMPRSPPPPGGQSEVHNIPYQCARPRRRSKRSIFLLLGGIKAGISAPRGRLCTPAVASYPIPRVGPEAQCTSYMHHCTPASSCMFVCERVHAYTCTPQSMQHHIVKLRPSTWDPAYSHITV